MSSMRPLSQSLTYTPAVMCIADTSTMPSVTPLFLTIAATSSVMRTISCRRFVLNHRQSVWTVVVVGTSYRRTGPRARRTWRQHRAPGTGNLAPAPGTGHGEPGTYKVQGTRYTV